jgi:hypothetical protein
MTEPQPDPIHTAPSPIIVMGMHRSGTTLLTQLLEECGVFWGALPDEYNEAAFFQSLNEALFSMANATWDAPESAECFFSEPDNQIRITTFLENRLKEGWRTEYIGGYEAVSTLTTEPSPALWGWKDPRNVFTLGLWLEHFPNARVIHILRNGIDVALSLWRRETSRPEGRDHPHYSTRCQELDGCFNLWKIYALKARGWVQSVNSVLEIRYENLIDSPLAVLHRVAGHIGLSFDERLTAAVDLIQPKKCGIHSSDPQLQSFINNARKDTSLRALVSDD